MLDPQKIPLARVKEAFALTVKEAENLVDALWPHHVLPWQLWREAYTKFWHGIAFDNAEVFGTNNPPFPEMTGIWADAPAQAWGSKMYGFFSEMVYALPARSLQRGLEYVLEETYGDSSTVFLAEREILFKSLEEAEKDMDWRFYPPTSAAQIDAMLNEKAFGNPKKSYGFIGQVIPDTMIVDKFLGSGLVNCQSFYISVFITPEVSHEHTVLSFHRADCAYQTLFSSVTRGAQS